MYNILEEFRVFQHVLLWFFVFLCFGVYVFLKKNRKYNLPPGPTGLPILGILPFLGQNAHLDLIKLSKKYGGIFSVYMGRTYVVVVTDVIAARQLLNKMSTADRPSHLFPLMPGGVGFSGLNGPEFIEQRRYTMMEMKNLGFGVSQWEKIIQMEVSDFLNLLEQFRGEPVDINDALSVSISNNILSLVNNQRLPRDDPRRDVLEHGIKSFQMLYSQSGLIVHYPKLFKFFADLGLLRTGHKLKNLMKMNKYIREEIEQLKQDKGGHSFIEKYLTEIEKNKQMNLGNSFTDINLLGNVQALIIAGSDTTFISLLWLFLAMAAFPKIQEKVHEELDVVLGKDRPVDWVDRQNLSYCFATILEGQRWRTIAPLNLLHKTNEDVVISGYDIPKGTDLMTVLWAFHHDTRYWEDPDTFQPERFLTDNGKAIKEPEAFLPFSYGRRMCPGKTVALIELFQYFVAIMQRFQILPASETSPIDLEGCLGLSLQPKRQLLRFVSR